MSERVYLSAPHMGGDELKFINEAFHSNWVSPAGPHITAFENELGDYLGGVSVAALSSGTAAIHLALIILGIEQGDEVICSSFTFSGTCNPIVYQKALPIFVDSEPETWNIDPALLREAIQDRLRRGKKPKAIIVVHLYGMPAKMNEILAIADEFAIPVIEDAAEALGSTYKGKRCGTFGHFGILSFNGNKIITTSGGGALTSNNPKWIEKARFLATQARDHAPHYQHSEIGYNYRLSNICAGIGRGQLKVLEDRVKRKREIFNWYKGVFGTGGGISFQPEAVEAFSNRWLSSIVLDEKLTVTPEMIRLTLEKDNIESRPLWKPMHMQPVFQDAAHYLNGVSEKLFKKGLCLPSGTVMDANATIRIGEKIKKLL